MNGHEDGFFKKMCKEATEELASGREGTWREISPNVLILACFGMLFNNLTHKITRPLWFFSGSVAAGVIGYIIHSFLR